MLCCWLLSAACSCALTAPSLAAETTLRLRVAWGGGRETQWHGSIRLSAGELSQIHPLGVEADETGTLWLEDGGVMLRGASGRTYDGVDLLASADLHAKLLVTLSDGETKENAAPVEIPLSELIAGAHSATLDNHGNRLLVARAPGDVLRVHFERPSLVFTPGEEFAFEVEPHLVGSATPTALRLRMQLSGTTGRSWSQDFDVDPADGEGNSARAKASCKIPQGEGVYELHIAAINTRLRERLPWKKPLAERSVQLVVVSSKPAPANDAAPLSKVLEIDPANPRWWDRLGNIPMMPGLRKGPLGNGDAARWDHAKLGSMIQLGGTNKSGDVSWEAYPLPIGSPGQPHILEIEYPSDVPQTMGISVLEPNAAGAVLPVTLDSGVYVSDEEADNPAALAKHRLVFWPRTKTPLLLITNRRQASRAVYGKIRVLSAPHSQFAAIANLGRQNTSPNVLPRALGGVDIRNGRLLAGYLERPLFGENFSAAEALDAASGRSLDDWNTFYQGSSRLVEYLHYAGYNGLMLSVLADGSTIYPTEHVESTPRYDSGMFFASGQDPVRKDVLEMIFRLFDRENLQLIPALHFSTPLPELEALRRQEGEPSVEWIGVEGRPWTDVHATRQGLAPYYNPLDQRVQAAMLTVVRELAQRYGAHPAFGGVAMQLSADGYAQLPSDGPYDDLTIAAFAESSGLKIPGTGPQRFVVRAKFLNGSANQAWLLWRAETLAKFHRQAQQEIAAAHVGAKLHLAGATMFDDPQLQRSLRPALPRRLKVDEVLLSIGVRPIHYPAKSGIVLVRPQRLAPLGSLPARAVDLELNTAPEVDRLFANSAPAGLFYHEPQRVRLASFDAKSPFGAANTFTSLISELSPSGDRNRRRFAHSLAAMDSQTLFDGGWLLPLGQEDALRDLVGVFRQLPAAPFETLVGDTQPVTIRTRVEGRQLYVYLVNDSPWNAKVTLNVQAAESCTMDRVGASRGVAPLARGPNGTTWMISLKPFDLVGARLSDPKARLINPRVNVNETVQVALQTRIQDLGARAAALGSPTPLNALANADFEAANDAGQVTGWTATAAPPPAADDTDNPPEQDVVVQLDSHEKHSGQRSLHFSSEARRAMLRSNPIEPPQTGRLSVSLWLRIADPKHQPTLRMALECTGDAAPYYRFAAVGGTGEGAIALGTRWAQYVFAVDDLPSEGLSELRARFELIGPGEVWIDDVQLFDLSFTENERVELTKIITLANFKLAAGQIGDCARMLDGYWPQFLVANVPLTQGPASVAQRPRTAALPAPARATVAPPAEEKPGVLNRVRGYVPKWW